LTTAARGAGAREAAFEILAATRKGELFNVARDRAVLGLPERDRRLAQEIAAGVLRHRRTLDRRLRRTVSRRWRATSADLRDLLRIGLYQLTQLSRVPPHAAVGTTVELAKARHGQRSAAFVNAVLRRTLRETADADVPGTLTPGQALAAQYSHPDWLVGRWLRRLGPAVTERLLRHNNTRPPLWLQPARWTRDAIVAAAQAAGFTMEAPSDGAGLVARARRPAELPGFADGAFVVQGPAQELFIEEARLPPGSLVWDACAAPGGKTVGLARTMRVIASDRPGVRLERLRETLRRAAPGVTLVAADARQPPIRPGAVDAVWVDAPCSATGTMARHPDARWRFTARRLAALTDLQEALLTGVAAVVPPGGLLVYTTCSLEPEENATQVERFLERHNAFRRRQPDVFVFPPDTGADGGYLAVLERA